MKIDEIRNNLKFAGEKILTPVIVFLNFFKLSPNTLTIFGFLIIFFAAYYIYKGKFVIAATVTLFASIFDMLDGALARKLNKKTKFGGFLDSTIDRLSEAVIYFGFLLFFLNEKNFYGSILTYSAMVFSFLVSYTRARASGLKIDCEIGLFTRPERIIIIILGLILNQLLVTIILINILSIITFMQRILKVHKEASLLDKNN
jgi:CDP-diacylglycerol--glycerol-3-phosphate 3-phosphatidyltransferase